MFKAVITYTNGDSYETTFNSFDTAYAYCARTNKAKEYNNGDYTVTLEMVGNPDVMKF